jgi:8-amino-7-oxononanoate synthase
LSRRPARYPHADVAALEQGSRASTARRKLTPPTRSSAWTANLAAAGASCARRRHGAWLVAVDDAHGFGAWEPCRTGSRDACAFLAESERIVYMGTLRAAWPAFVAAHPAVIDTPRRDCAPYVFRRLPRRCSPKAAREPRIIGSDAARHENSLLIAHFASACVIAMAPSSTRRPRSSPSSSAANAAAVGSPRRFGSADSVPVIRPLTVPKGRRDCARSERAHWRATSMRSPTLRRAAGDDRGKPGATEIASMSATLHVESAGIGPPLVLLHG